MPTPTMIDGMRQPQSVRLEEARKQNAVGLDPATVAATLAPAGVNVYISHSRGYLVEVMNKRAFVHEGERVPAQRVAAQFVEGVFRNDHPDPEVRKLIDERLQRNKYFGKFGDGKAHFWLLADMQKATKAAQVKSALDTLKTLPREQVEQYLADLKQGDAEDHDLGAALTPAPAAEAATQRSTRPIAAKG